MEEVLVPLYLHHRYQVEAAASAVGGMHYIYAMRGDGRDPSAWLRPPSSARRSGADGTLKPSELALPPDAAQEDSAAAVGIRPHARAVPALHGSDVRRDHTGGGRGQHDSRFPARRRARGAARGAARVGSGDAWTRLGTDELIAATSKVQTASPYQAEISRAVQRVVMEHVMTLAGSAEMPQVRALATARLLPWKTTGQTANDANGAHRAALGEDIRRFLDRPLTPVTRADLLMHPQARQSASPRWIGSGASSRRALSGSGRRIEHVRTSARYSALAALRRITRVARRAGSQDAINATSGSATSATPNATGSRGVISKIQARYETSKRERDPGSGEGVPARTGIMPRAITRR